MLFTFTPEAGLAQPAVLLLSLLLLLDAGTLRPYRGRLTAALRQPPSPLARLPSSHPASLHLSGPYLRPLSITFLPLINARGARSRSRWPCLSRFVFVSAPPRLCTRYRVRCARAMHWPVYVCVRIPPRPCFDLPCSVCL